MPIDSEDKRRSVPKIIPGVPGLSGVFMEPDGSIDSVADREHIAGFYRGLPPTPIIAVGRKKGLLLGIYP